MDCMKILETYKAVTLDMIKHVQADESIDGFMERRQALLEEFVNFPLSKEEKVKLMEESNIKAVDDSLKIALQSEMISVKEEIEKIKKRKNANRAYGVQTANREIFNKQII